MGKDIQIYWVYNKTFYKHIIYIFLILLFGIFLLYTSKYILTMSNMVLQTIFLLLWFFLLLAVPFSVIILILSLRDILKKVGYSKKGIHFVFLRKEILKPCATHETWGKFISINNLSPQGYNGIVNYPKFISWNTIKMIKRGKRFQFRLVKIWPFLEIWTTQDLITISDKDKKLLSDLYNQYRYYQKNKSNYSYRKNGQLKTNRYKEIP